MTLSRYRGALLLIALSPLLILLTRWLPIEDLSIFLGRFHPVVLHLPIGILLLVAMIEAADWLLPDGLPVDTSILLFIGSASCYAALSLGTLLMWGEAVSGSAVDAHFYWGIGTAVAAWLCLALRLRPDCMQQPQSRLHYRAALFATCGILTFASHLGGSLTHGETYLTEYNPLRSHTAEQAAREQAKANLLLPPEQRQVYAHLIAPLFALRCNSCHESRNFKGQLVMDTWDGLQRGGASGPLFVPGAPADSLLLDRIHLPLADEEHMPPSSDPQLTDEESRLLHWWIESGATNTATVAALQPAPELLDDLRAVTTTLLSKIDAQPADASHGEQAELAAVAEARAPFAEALADAQTAFPGSLEYASARSNHLIARSLYTPVTDQHLANLAPVAALVHELKIPNAPLTAASIPALQRLTELRSADFSRSTLTDAHLAALPPVLEVLNLFGTPITDQSIPALSALSSLKRLFLSYTHTTEDGIRQLRAALPACQIHAGAQALIPTNEPPQPGKRERKPAPTVQKAQITKLPDDIPKDWRWISQDATAAFSSTSEWSDDFPDTLLTTLDGQYAFHTQAETEPWLLITLQREAALQGIEILNREGLESRAQQLFIEISTDLKSWQSVFTAKAPETRWLTPLPGDPRARFIRIGSRNDPADFLHLKGVRVFGLPSASEDR